MKRKTKTKQGNGIRCAISGKLIGNKEVILADVSICKTFLAKHGLMIRPRDLLDDVQDWFVGNIQK